MSKLNEPMPAQKEASSALPQKGSPEGTQDLAPRTLHFFWDGTFTHRRLFNADSQQTTRLYNISYRSALISRSRRPPISITRPSDNSEIGTVIFRSFHPTQLTVNGNIIALERISRKTYGRKFQSVATGSLLTWRNDSARTYNMTCFNESNQWLARFTVSGGFFIKTGVLELACPEVDGNLLDEIVISFLAYGEERIEGRTRWRRLAQARGGFAAAGC